jgi:hypothetical protein
MESGERKPHPAGEVLGALTTVALFVGGLALALFGLEKLKIKK